MCFDDSSRVSNQLASLCPPQAGGLETFKSMWYRPLCGLKQSILRSSCTSRQELENKRSVTDAVCQEVLRQDASLAEA